MTQRNYSRLAEIEKEKNRRTTFVYVGLTILFIIFLIVFGIRVVSQAAGFLTGPEDGLFDNQDKTPPAPPRINYIPEFTNKDELIIEGTSEAGSKIQIDFDDSDKEILVGSDGSFTTTVNLNEGENTFSFVAVDTAGNESTRTKSYTVSFDKEKPEVEIISPADGAKFYSSAQKKINIEGKTESSASVTINDRVVVLNSEGKFSFATELGDGENNFNVKSTDKAGNMTEKDVKYHYSP